MQKRVLDLFVFLLNDIAIIPDLEYNITGIKIYSEGT